MSRATLNSIDPVLLHTEPPRTIGVFRALQLGDMLCAIPALRALRQCAPRARITLIGLPWAREFAVRYRHELDGFIAFPGTPGLPEQSAQCDAWPAFLTRVQAQRFDLLLQLHGDGRVTNPLVALFGARRLAGFAADGAYCPDSRTFVRFPHADSELQGLLQFVRALARRAPTAGDDALHFPLTTADRAQLASAATAAGAALRAGDYICVHPGARGRTRRWPTLKFAQVADALANAGYRVVLTGSAAERDLVSAVAAAMRTQPLRLDGATSLGALAALLADARLLVCNDTGVSHLAAALKTPSVVVVTGSDPARWAPQDRARHRVLSHPVPCRPCAYDRCDHDFACAGGVDVDAVVTQARSLLEDYPRAA